MVFIKQKVIQAGGELYTQHVAHLSAVALAKAERTQHHTSNTPWGEIWHEHSSVPDMSKFRFTGKELDATKFYYFGARYYDPQVSLWISTDPALDSYLDSDIGLGGMYNSRNLGLFTYAHQNSMIMVDPDGNFVDVISLLKDINDVAQQLHYWTHRSSDEGLTTKSDVKTAGFEYMSNESMDICHEQGMATEGYDPKYNDKYTRLGPFGISSDEVIVNSKTNKVVKNDPVNMASRNIVDPNGKKYSSTREKVIRSVLHSGLDYMPYVIWGNNSEDAKTTTWIERATGTYKGKSNRNIQRQNTGLFI